MNKKTIFNVHVPEDKASFFRDLLINLGIQYECSNAIDKKPELDIQDVPEYKIDEETRKKANELRHESLQDVIQKLNERRSG